MMLATTPVTCPSGTAAIERSGCGQIQARHEDHRRMDYVAMRQHRALRPPRGARRVEDHRGVFFADLGWRRRWRVAEQRGKWRRPAIVIDGDSLLQIGNVVRVGQTVRQRRLVDQEFGAAVGQHIGNLGLLLAGATATPSPSPLPPRRTPSARIRCGCRAAARHGRRPASPSLRNPAAICRDCSATSRQVIRRSPHTSASPSGFLRRGIRDHRPDAFGRWQNAGTTRSPKRDSSRMGGMECATSP